VVLHGNHLVVGEFVTLAANPVETLCVGVGVGVGVGVLVRDCKHALCTLQNSSWKKRCNTQKWLHDVLLPFPGSLM